MTRIRSADRSASVDCCDPARLRRRRFLAAGVVALLPLLIGPVPARESAPGGQPPNVLLITVDTLRADRMSAYGYERPTTPNLDRLIAEGVRFDDARTVEPLTSPALCSMLTSLEPQEHGSSRNGLRIRSGLASLPKALQAHGYRTAAFVGNWTLRDKLTGLAEHFETYDEVLTRRRWFGLLRSEATGDDLTEEAGDWLADHLRSHSHQPFLAWVHYVEPHAPYRLHRDLLEGLGLADADGPSDRYDTEVAFVDQAIGTLLQRLDELGLDRRTLIVFAADHGESLGEHGYWGHGRNLYEPNLRIPMALAWPGRIRPGAVAAPSLNLDLAPTILGLLGYDSPPGFRGFDWTPVLDGASPPAERVTEYQAHRGAVMSRHDSDLARRAGLLAVARMRGDVKEIFTTDGARELYDLARDPLESHDLTGSDEQPSEAVQVWMRTVYAGLTDADETPPQPLDPESVEHLRSLGYID